MALAKVLSGLLIGWLFWSLPAVAKQASDGYVYYWFDDNGKLHISDMKPPGAGATRIPLKKAPKIGSVKPKGSCDPSVGYKSEAKFWTKNQRNRRNNKALYRCQ